MVDNACDSDLRSYAYFFVVYFSCVTIRRWQEFIPTNNVQKSYFRDILFLLFWCRTVTVSRHPCCFAGRSWIPVVCSVTSLTLLLSAGCVCHRGQNTFCPWHLVKIISKKIMNTSAINAEICYNTSCLDAFLLWWKQKQANAQKTGMFHVKHFICNSDKHFLV